MLKPAYFYDKKEIEKLAYREMFEYDSFSYYEDFGVGDIPDNDSVEKCRVSVNDDGKVLGFFKVQFDRKNRKALNMYLVKFKSSYEKGDSDIVRWDLRIFIQELIDDPEINSIEFKCFVDNPANKLYDYWIKKYGFERFLFKNHIWKGNKWNDTYLFYLSKGGRNESINCSQIVRRDKPKVASVAFEAT